MAHTTLQVVWGTANADVVLPAPHRLSAPHFGVCCEVKQKIKGPWKPVLNKEGKATCTSDTAEPEWGRCAGANVPVDDRLPRYGA